MGALLDALFIYVPIAQIAIVPVLAAGRRYSPLAWFFLSLLWVAAYYYVMMLLPGGGILAWVLINSAGKWATAAAFLCLAYLPILSLFAFTRRPKVSWRQKRRGRRFTSKLPLADAVKPSTRGRDSNTASPAAR